MTAILAGAALLSILAAAAVHRRSRREKARAEEVERETQRARVAYVESTRRAREILAAGSRHPQRVVPPPSPTASRFSASSPVPRVNPVDELLELERRRAMSEPLVIVPIAAPVHEHTYNHAPIHHAPAPTCSYDPPSSSSSSYDSGTCDMGGSYSGSND